MSVFEGAGTPQPEARLLGVWERRWSRGRTGGAGWGAAPGVVIRAGVARRLAEPAKKHRDKRHEHDERRVGERQEVEPAVNSLGHLNRVTPR